MVLDDWINDIPFQFQGKKNIEVLMKAFARQLEEVYAVFAQLDFGTDIMTATGKTLDYIGTIVGLSRKEAIMLSLRIGMNVNVTDDIYRRFLLYKNLVNTTDNTYQDILKGVRILWGDSNSRLYYTEKVERPATIFFSTPRIDLDEKDNVLMKSLHIKPSGVGLVYENSYKSVLNLQKNERIIHSRLKAKVYQIFTERLEEMIRIKVDCKLDKSSILAEVTTVKNEWFLDGEHLLDGTKSLDSMRGKETL